MKHNFHACTITRKDLFRESYIFPEEDILDEEDEELKQELELNELLYERVK